MDNGYIIALYNLYQNRDKKERQKLEAKDEKGRNKSVKLKASETKQTPIRENSSSAYQLRKEVILHDLKNINYNTKTRGNLYIPQNDVISPNHKRGALGKTQSIHYITITRKKFLPDPEKEANNKMNILLPNQVDYS